MKFSRWFGAVVGMLLGMWAMAFAQSWTAPKTWSQGELVTPSMLNTHLRDNITVLRAGGLAISGQAANRIPYATSATQLATSAGLTFDGTDFLSGGDVTATADLIAAGGLRVDNNSTLGDATSDVVTINGYVNSATGQPGFLAYNSADDAGVTTGATVDFDTEVYDTTGSFAADVFTAPVSGIYQFCAAARVLGSGAFEHTLQLVTTARTYELGLGVSSLQEKLSGCVHANMTASDTANIAVTTASGTLTIGGDGTVLESYFSGRLVP